MAVLDTATLAEAALVLRTYGALCVNDTMFYVRWLLPTKHGLAALEDTMLHSCSICQIIVVSAPLMQLCFMSVLNTLHRHHAHTEPANMDEEVFRSLSAFCT